MTKPIDDERARLVRRWLFTLFPLLKRCGRHSFLSTSGQTRLLWCLMLSLACSERSVNLILNSVQSPKPFSDPWCAALNGKVGPLLRVQPTTQRRIRVASSKSKKGSFQTFSAARKGKDLIVGHGPLLNFAPPSSSAMQKTRNGRSFRHFTGRDDNAHFAAPRLAPR